MKSPFTVAFGAGLCVGISCAPAAETILIEEGASCDYLVPSVVNGGSSLGLEWIGATDPANFANWVKGATSAIGYDTDLTPDYDDVISTDVESEMSDEHSTIYIRLKFQIADAAELAAVKSLTLNMRSDDGFIAYLNGGRVADRNPPTEPDWDSTASGSTGDAIAEPFAPFSLAPFIGDLVVGENVLALHGLNVNDGSSDFLISPQLIASDDEVPVPSLVEVASGFDRPVDIQNAGDGSRRLFVVEKRGRVRIVSPLGLHPTPFLDIESRVDDSSNEEGLLGLAFPPDFATKQYFYVNYTGGNSETLISRFSVSANPDLADEGSEEILLRVPQFQSNHNGGQIQFGPDDGYLYIAFGDGGSGNDPGDRAQNPQNLLGKMVRIDVEGTPDPGLAYAIPPSNPFVDDATTHDEIWALGLRNPFRFSFDQATGDMYIGDVGQNAFEEVNFEPAGSPGGANYGWVHWEASRLNTQAPNGHRVPSDPVFPVHEYSQDEGGISVIAGYVYRGTRFPRMRGIFYFSDYRNGDLRGLWRNGAGEWQWQSFLAMNIKPTSFGLDEDGTLHVVSDSSGGGSNRLYRIEDARDANYLQVIDSGTNQDGLPFMEVGVEIGRFYNMQFSTDLEFWFDVDEPEPVFSGHSMVFELPEILISPPRQFLRVVETN